MGDPDGSNPTPASPPHAVAVEMVDHVAPASRLRKSPLTPRLPARTWPARPGLTPMKSTENCPASRLVCVHVVPPLVLLKTRSELEPVKGCAVPAYSVVDEAGSTASDET